MFTIQPLDPPESNPHRDETEAHEATLALADEFDAAWEEHQTEITPERSAEISFAMRVIHAREVRAGGEPE